MKVFEKYTKRRAIVLMPSYEDYVKSLVTNEKSTNETYMSLVNDMKGLSGLRVQSCKVL